MSIREFLDALRSTQGQHTLASVLEGPESGARLLLCEGVPVWPARPEGLLARNLPALAGCGASGILTLENKRVFVEKFGGTPRLVICGGGHVAESVVRLAVMLGLPVTGLEERPDYADALRRAGAEKVLCGPYAENLTQVEGSAETYFVVATRAHSFDVECLTEIYKKRLAYVGMLGSRSRSALVRRQLIEAGTAPEKAEELHAPIGLAIKAQTAQEIALSILAEIVEVKNGRQQTEGFPPELLNALDAWHGTGKGSCPRDHRFPPRFDPPGGGSKDAGAAGRQIRGQCGRRHYGIPCAAACIKNAGRRGCALPAGKVFGQRKRGRCGAGCLRRLDERVPAAAQGGRK